VGSIGRESRTVLKRGSDFYILASSLASRRTVRVLADSHSFVVFDVDGDIKESPLEALGFFSRDTRYLSRFELRIAGKVPYFLSSRLSDDNAQLRINLSNPDLGAHADNIKLPRNSIEIVRDWVLTEGTLFHQIVVRNYLVSPVELPLDFLFAVDFVDVFEVRGVKRVRHGEILKPRFGNNSIRFLYEGLDRVKRFADVVFDTAPAVLDGGRATFPLRLAAGEKKKVEIRIFGGSDHPAASVNRRKSNPVNFDAALISRQTETADFVSSWARLSTSNELFNGFLERSRADLTSLISSTTKGTYVMAGIPWFATLFGRDSIITALSVLPFNQDIAVDTLRSLAAWQGSSVDDTRDEQPGKIVHETREGEMAANGEIPFGRYYGSVDATPLFLWLLGRCVEISGNLDLAEELWPSAERALEWIERWGDRDGDGYIEYMRETPRGLSNQGWKDSSDAIFHASGELARAPIALAEVQGYLYAACSTLADVAMRMGRGAIADRLATRAESIKQAFSRDFWLDSKRTVALALDAEKQPCRVMTSNAAHCLAAGLLDNDQAAALSDRLLADDMFSGWGLRTLSTNEQRYNPMSYHNGSVWPHDNGIAAMGLARYGNRAGALRILEGLFDSAIHLQTGSLPELFCGFSRERGLGPVSYPVACYPQAWSAASIFMVLQAILGLEVQGFRGQVVLDSPTLPAWLEWVRVEDLKVGHCSVSILWRRTGDGSTAIDLLKKRGAVSIEVT
jgi:glycogen debranching enzyme